MLRNLAITPVLLLAAGLAHGAIFPDQIGDFKKSAPKTVSVRDRTLDDEYGFEATEQAAYIGSDKDSEKHFLATAWRFKDSTGAMAFFEQRRPSGAAPAKLTQLSVATADGAI